MLSRARRGVFVLVLMLFGLAGAAGAAERRVALVIGNGTYQNGGSVPGAANSAQAVAEALRKAGFDVMTQFGLDHRNLVRALSRFQENLARADLGAFYYAGMVLSVGDKSFIVPTDARLGMEVDVMLETIELDSVLEQIQNASYRSIVMFDPIVPNPLADRLAASMGANGGSVKPLLATTAPRDRMVIAYGQRPGTVPVPTRTNGPSAFAAALAEEIAKPGVDVKRALQAVDQAVTNRSGGAQRIWFEDRLDGELVLLPGAPPEQATSKGESSATPAAPAVIAAPLPGRKPTPPPEAPPVAVVIEPHAGTYYATRKVNLLKDPDGKAPRVRVLEKAEAVPVTGKVKVGNTEWMRVEEGGRTGFVQTASLAKDPPPEPVQQARVEEPAKAAPSVRVKEGEVYFARDEVAMVDRPAQGARNLRSLDRGAPVTVVAAAPENDRWIKVRDVFWNEGYVPLASLGEGGRKPDAPKDTIAKLDEPKGTPQSGSAQSGSTQSGSTGTPERQPSGASDEAGREGAEREAGAPDDPYANLPPPIRTAAMGARDATRQAVGKRNAGRAAAERAREAQRLAQRAAQDPRSAFNTQFPNGDSFRGQGDGRTKNGVGVYRFANGGSYEGEWKNDAMTGYGVFTFPGGERFEGHFVNGNPQGSGVYHFANGDVFAGEARNGRPQGLGELVFGNGDRYQGSIIETQPDGLGTLTFRSGDRFVGTFRDGLQNGPGVRIAKGGAGEDLVIPGVWQGSVIVQK